MSLSYILTNHNSFGYCHRNLNSFGYCHRNLVAFAQQAFKAISSQREIGLATVLDMLSVEQTLLDAHINYVRAQAEQELTGIQLRALMENLR